MSLLGGKKILLGISGGIAAYKTPLIVRELIKFGAEVRVLMTPDAKHFVTPLTLSTLSNNPVLSSFTATDLDNPIWNDHVELGMWADAFLIAPATSNTISAMANGSCNNLLLAVYFSARCPIFIAPSMDLEMYAHPSNQKNISTLKSYGHNILPVGKGKLASGLEGKGRMLEPDEILSKISHFFNKKLPLKGKKVLITAGPTYEAIDPVRFIGNNSSGKMGYALAEVACNLGAKVHLISGPSKEKIKHSSISLVHVITAEEMHKEVKKYYSNADIAISAAAVSDFKLKTPSSKKIKKTNSKLMVNFSPTVDILAYMGTKKKDQYLLGFAIETEDEIKNAKDKLIKKNLDGIVLNSLRDKGAGFSVSTNKITFIHSNNKQKKFSIQSKFECAKCIFDQILSK